MNKREIELKQERTDAALELRAILDQCKLDKRAKTAKESDAWNKLEKKILTLDRQIDAAASSSQGKTSRTFVNPNLKNDKEFDLGRAILGLKNNNYSDFDRQINAKGHKEFALEPQLRSLVIPENILRAAVTTSTHASDINTVVAGLDVVAAPSIYRNLGCTVWNNQKGNIVLNFSDGHDAAFVAEGASAPESSPNRVTATLNARRVTGFKTFSKEQLAQSEVMKTEFEDMIAAIDRAISAEVVNQAVAANVISGRGTGDAAANIDYFDAIGMLSGLETDEFKNPAYVMSQQLKINAAGITKDSGSGQFIVEENKILGSKCVGTTLLPLHDTNKYDICFGDFSKAYIAFFGGGMEILIDPYTLGSTGMVKIYFSKLADVAVNPAAFQSIRNASLV